MKDDITMPGPAIETERFALRPVQKSDAGMIAHYASDRALARMTPTIAHPLPPGSIDALIDRVMGDAREDVWILDGTDHNGPEVMGLVALKHLDDTTSELEYWIAPPFWGMGHAQAAVRALIENNPLSTKIFFASVFQDNLASARVLTNCGFQYLGDAESFSVARNSTVPTWTYSLKHD